MRAGGVIVELGPPIERFRDAEFFYRKALLNTACTSQFDYASFDDGTQQNTMVVYSGAEPGSADQLQCLEMQALVSCGLRDLHSRVFLRTTDLLRLLT